MVHEQKFKDLLSSKFPVSPERRVLDLESEVIVGPGSIPTGDNSLALDCFCFHVVKSLMPILVLLPISSSLWKTRLLKKLTDHFDKKKKLECLSVKCLRWPPDCVVIFSSCGTSHYKWVNLYLSIRCIQMELLTCSHGFGNQK